MDEELDSGKEVERLWGGEQTSDNTRRAKLTTFVEHDDMILFRATKLSLSISRTLQSYLNQLLRLAFTPLDHLFIAMLSVSVNFVSDRDLCLFESSELRRLSLVYVRLRIALVNTCSALS